MMIPNAETNRTPKAAILAIGFGTSLTMWGVAYVCRLPAVIAPSWLVMIAMLICLWIGGFVAGRHTAGGVRAGLSCGMLTAIINLLVLGSLLAGEETNRVVPSALWWVPGSILVSALLASLGATMGARFPRAGWPELDWTSAFARVAVVATFLLLIVGGLVTSKEAGLAVVDWPNSYGYNMFLYPLAKMTGGIYYEHAHRLFGTLVGLTTLVLAIHLWVTPNPNGLRALATVGFLTVVVQGILGGLRVTGGFTMSNAPEEMAPSTELAAIHGIVGQVFLGIMVAIAVVASKSWKTSQVGTNPSSPGVDRVLAILLLVVLFLQVGSGSIVRHTYVGIMVHIALAVLVLMLAAVAGARAWGPQNHHPILQRTGRLVIIVTGLQLVLGLLAFSATHGRPIPSAPTAFDVLATTAHQAGGAVVVACAVAFMLWTQRVAALSDGQLPSR